MLRVFLEDCESVGNPCRLLILLGLEDLVELLQLGTVSELDVSSCLPHKFVARCDISLHYLLQILKELFLADLQLGADASTNGLLKLLNVYMDDVVGEELPGEGDIVGALGRGTEDELTIVLALEQLDGLLRVDVLELRVIDATNVELTLSVATALFVHLEGRVDQILRLADYDTFGEEVSVILQVNSLAGEGDTELGLFLVSDLINATCDNLARLYDLFQASAVKI